MLCFQLCFQNKNKTKSEIPGAGENPSEPGAPGYRWFESPLNLGTWQEYSLGCLFLSCVLGGWMLVSFLPLRLEKDPHNQATETGALRSGQ